MKGDWDTHGATQWHICLHMTMERCEADMGSQVDMHIDTDAFTHTNQGVDHIRVDRIQT